MGSGAPSPWIPPALGAGGVRVVEVAEEFTGLAKKKGLNSILGSAT